MQPGWAVVLTWGIMTFTGGTHDQCRAQSTTPQSERAIRKDVRVPASLDEVWDAWTTSDGLMSFMAPKAHVELVPLGPYEITFDPEDERQGTKGLKLLGFLPKEFLSFQWNASPEYPTVRANPGWVVVQFEELESGEVEVSLTHWGWLTIGSQPPGAECWPAWKSAFDPVPSSGARRSAGCFQRVHPTRWDREVKGRHSKGPTGCKSP
jgi:uncharacterized protein YndB with AHSA1/START domain